MKLSCVHAMALIKLCMAIIDQQFAEGIICRAIPAGPWGLTLVPNTSIRRGIPEDDLADSGVSHASFIKEISKTAAAEKTKDNDAEKVGIRGGEFGVFSTSVASTDAIEILDENDDKVINGTFNSDDIIDPTGMEEGGNNKVEMRRERGKEERENDYKKEVEWCAACVVLCRDEEGDIIRNIQDEGGRAGWI